MTMMNPEDANIPTVGQPARVIFWYPTTIVQCHCKEGELTLIILSGFGNPSLCQKCGKLYQLKGLQPGDKGLAAVIEMMLPPQQKTSIQ